MRHFSKILVTILLTVLFLEAGLRAEGFISSYLRERRNRINLKQKGVYRILCFGESMTAGRYPSFLEKKLNQLNIGIKFSVIDGAASGADTAYILGNLESNLDIYHPDMVIIMAGFLDRGERVLFGASPVSGLIRFLNNCRVYKLAMILKLEAAAKLQELSLERSIRRPGAAKKIISLEPEKEEVFINPASVFIYYQSLNQEQLAQRESILRQAVESDPYDSRAYLSLGAYYRYRGNVVQAKSAIKKAIRINPKNYQAYVALGGCYRDSGEVGMAIGAFRKARELNPRDGRLYSHLGRIYKEQGDFSLAEAAFKKAMELSPAYPFVYSQLGVFYREQGRYVQSEEAFEEALSHGPGDENLHIELGNLYKIQQKFAQAKEEYTKALDLNPNNFYAYSALGKLHHDQGNLSQEEEIYKKFIELNPDSDQGYAQLGLFYRMQGKFSQADDLFKKTLELNPRNDRVLAARPSLYEEAGWGSGAEDSKGESNRLFMAGYLPYTADNFRKIKEILDRRGVRLVSMQYPMRNVELLKTMFRGDDENVIFIDNEKIFRDAVKESGFSDYFINATGGDYGHCTEKGSRLMADNIAGVVSREVFHKQ